MPRSLIGAQIELAGAFAAPAFVVREAPEVLEHQLELGRRSSGLDRWGIGVESEVREEAHETRALRDERHEPPPGTAVVAAQDVDAEDAWQELGPQVAVRRPRRGGFLGTRGVRATRRRAGDDHVVAQRRARREDAVVSLLMGARRRHERRETLEEDQGDEHDVRCAVTPGASEFVVHDSTVGREAQGAPRRTAGVRHTDTDGGNVDPVVRVWASHVGCPLTPGARRF